MLENKTMCINLRRFKTMFLFWLGVFVVCCIAENLKDSYDAYKYKASGEEERALRRIRGEKYK